MKKLFILFSFFISLLAAGQDEKSPADTNAYKFILDYAVPSSPAFTVLDATPQQVTRGSAAKPLIFHAFTNFLQTGRLDPGIAADFSPYVLLGGGFQNLEHYRTSWGRRVLANSMLSAAVLKSSRDSSNSDIGLGIRITFFDDHDLFANSKTARTITDKIGTALAGAAKAPVIAGQIPDDEIGTSEGGASGTVAVDLDRFYTDAYNSLREVPGFALSAGFGYRTTALSSSLAPDSLVNQQSRLWVSSTRYTSGGFDIFGIVEGTFNMRTKDSATAKERWIAGLAAGSKNKRSNMGAEIVYDFSKNEWNYGANFEIRIFKQFTYVVSLGKRTVYVNGIDLKSAFRVISNFRLNLFGH